MDMIKLCRARSTKLALLFVTLLSFCDCIISYTTALGIQIREENSTVPYFGRTLQSDASHHSGGHSPHVHASGSHRLGHKVVYKKVPYWKAVKKGIDSHPSMSL